MFKPIFIFACLFLPYHSHAKTLSDSALANGVYFKGLYEEIHLNYKCFHTNTDCFVTDINHARHLNEVANQFIDFCQSVIEIYEAAYAEDLKILKRYREESAKRSGESKELLDDLIVKFSEKANTTRTRIDKDKARLSELDFTSDFQAIVAQLQVVIDHAKQTGENRATEDFWRSQNASLRTIAKRAFELSKIMGFHYGGYTELDDSNKTDWPKPPLSKSHSSISKPHVSVITYEVNLYTDEEMGAPINYAHNSLYSIQAEYTNLPMPIQVSMIDDFDFIMWIVGNEQTEPVSVVYSPLSNADMLLTWGGDNHRCPTFVDRVLNFSTYEANGKIIVYTNNYCDLTNEERRFHSTHNLKKELNQLFQRTK